MLREISFQNITIGVFLVVNVMVITKGDCKFIEISVSSLVQKKSCQCLFRKITFTRWEVRLKCLSTTYCDLGFETSSVFDYFFFAACSTSQGRNQSSQARKKKLKIKLKSRNKK